MNDYLMSESEIKIAKNQRKMGFELLPKAQERQKSLEKMLKKLNKDFANQSKRHDKEVANLRQKIAENEIDIAYYESITSGTASPESVYEAFKQRQNAQKERI